MGQSVVDQINQQYVPAFIVLYQHYKQSGELEKAEKLKTLIKKVAGKGAHASEIEAYLGNK